MAAQIQRFAGTSNLPFSAATKADGLIYVAGTIVAEGDIRNQTRRVLESLDATLQKAGSSLANAASVHVYLKTVDDFAAMNEVYRTFWKADPPVRTTVVADFVVPNALVEIAAGRGADRRRAQGHPPGELGEVAEPLQLRHQDAATRCSSPGCVARNGKDNTRGRGRHGRADQDRAGQRRRGPQGRRHGLRARGGSRVFITDVKKLPGDERRLPHLLPQGPAGPGDGGRAADGAAVPGRNHDDRGERRPSRPSPRRPPTARPGKPSPILSSAVKVGNRLYVSGMLGNTRRDQGQHGGADQGSAGARSAARCRRPGSAGATWSTASSTSPTRRSSTR